MRQSDLQCKAASVGDAASILICPLVDSGLQELVCKKKHTPVRACKYTQGPEILSAERRCRS